MLSEIERALLGDREAQEAFTARGELLPCPFCLGKYGGIDGIILKFDIGELYAHKRTGKCVLDGMIIYDKAQWNTRAPLLTPTQMEVLGIAREPRKFEERMNHAGD